MALPASFARDGFTPGSNPKEPKRFKLKNGKYLKRLMIGTQGPTDSGKSEFSISAPGPGIVISIDRNFDALMDNPNPPASRNPNFYFDAVSAPLDKTQPSDPAGIAVYVEYFKAIRDRFYKALANEDALTVVIDCHSDLWELHRLAHFGKLDKVWPQTKYGAPKAEHRALIARAWDSGKIVIGTNKIRDEYKALLDNEGKVQLDKQGEELRTKTGKQERQGFPDQDYLWHIQLEHLYEPEKTVVKGREKVTVPRRWGIRILKCKANMELVGEELWGSDCNFRTLVELVYPEIDPENWGY